MTLQRMFWKRSIELGSLPRQASTGGCDTLAAMRISHFWTLMNDEFGETYAPTLARDHVLGVLGGRSVAQALDDGMHPRLVWLALCDDMDVPQERRLGRDDPARHG